MDISGVAGEERQPSSMALCWNSAGRVPNLRVTPELLYQLVLLSRTALYTIIVISRCPWNESRTQSEYNYNTSSGSSLSKGSWDGVVFFERRQTGACSTAGSYTRSHFRETQLVDRSGERVVHLFASPLFLLGGASSSSRLVFLPNDPDESLRHKNRDCDPILQFSM